MGIFGTDGALGRKKREDQFRREDFVVVSVVRQLVPRGPSDQFWSCYR